MINLSAALQAGVPEECTLDAVVADEPRNYYGNRTHAMHEAFHVMCQGQRLEVVQNLRCGQQVPVQPGDGVTLHGELVPHGSHGPLMHWTHPDPNGRHEGGWIIDRGKRYG
jgi:hypothetical protein